MNKAPRTWIGSLPAVETYRGFAIERCLYGSHCVNLGTRTRFGTLAEIRADIDAHRAGELKAPQRGWA